MRLNTDGLVIREQDIGEADRLVTVLTGDYGVVRAFVRGARRVKSRSLSSTQLLSYSRFSIYKGRDSYIIDEAEPIEVFFNLRSDIEKLALAQYFLELSVELAPEEDEARDFLRLILNSLYFLCNDKRPPLQVKSTVELRILSLAGYMPNLIACESCGEFTSEFMYLDLYKSLIYCGLCHSKEGLINLPSGVLAAMRHICYAELDKLFNFTLSEDGFIALSNVTEQYLLVQTQRGYKTLDFFNSL